MRVYFTVVFDCELDEEDAKAIAADELDPKELNWSYYTDNYSSCWCDSVEIEED